MRERATHNVVAALLECAGKVTGECWDGYEAFGLNKKGGKMCVPKK